jgi:flagellar assembly factor FliW
MTPATSTQTSAVASRTPELEAPPQLSRDVVRFPHGLPGFEACRGFVLLASDALGPLQCLKAIEGPAASFLVMDPRCVMPDYRCELSETDYRRLGATADDTLLWRALVTIELDGTITVNLRAPIVINPTHMVGYQVVPYDCVYPIRHVVTQGD